ncbi:hypothetical protein H6P81_006924 [Aristolochia fimbriata]|uniref:Uncharacterized protein n=1 Tax=Aristolochia fimbriata TaxID=158543 RepID=A0AAV7EYN9_ARIFI|nr:hypothetical protein H6P81_006924 [Aristolochia fimbriata]
MSHAEEPSAVHRRFALATNLHLQCNRGRSRHQKPRMSRAEESCRTQRGIVTEKNDCTKIRSSEAATQAEYGTRGHKLAATGIALAVQLSPQLRGAGDQEEQARRGCTHGAIVKKETKVALKAGDKGRDEGRDGSHTRRATKVALKARDDGRTGCRDGSYAMQSDEGRSEGPKEKSHNGAHTERQKSRLAAPSPERNASEGRTL